MPGFMRLISRDYTDFFPIFFQSHYELHTCFLTVVFYIPQKIPGHGLKAVFNINYYQESGENRFQFFKFI